MAVSVEEFFATLGLKVHDKEFEKGESKLDKLTEKLKQGLEVLGAFEVGKKVFEWVEGTEEAAVGAKHMADRMGVSVEAVQELGYAANVTGVSTEELSGAFSRLAAGVDDFAHKGTGPAAEAFQRLHISAKQLKGLSLDQQFELVSDKINGVKDASTRLALTRDIFGHGSSALIPLMKEGSKGIDELRGEAEDLGDVIGGHDVESFEELEKTQKRVSGALTGIKNQVVVAMLPALKDLAEGVLAWVKANRQVIASGIKGLVEGLVIALKGLALAFVVVGNVVAFFADHSDVAKAALIGLTAVLAYFGAVAAATWIEAAALPLLVVGAIAAVAYAVIKLVKNWDKVKDAVRHALRAAGDAIKSFFSSVVTWFESLPGRAVKAIEDLATYIKDKILDALHAVEQWLIDFVKSIPGRVKNGIAHLADPIGGAVVGVAQKAIGGPHYAEAGPDLSKLSNAALFYSGHSDIVADRVDRTHGTATTIGDINTTINVSGAGDPQALTKTLDDHFTNKMGDVLRQAQDTVAPGRGSAP